MQLEQVNYRKEATFLANSTLYIPPKPLGLHIHEYDTFLRIKLSRILSNVIELYLQSTDNALKNINQIDITNMML